MNPESVNSQFRPFITTVFKLERSSKREAVTFTKMVFQLLTPASSNEGVAVGN